MLRWLLLAILSVGIALGGGIASAWLLLRSASFLPAAPGWHAVPDRAALVADPYRRDPAGYRFTPGARAGEKLFLAATRSDDGAPLVRNCSYLLAGRLPSSRIWTVSVVDENLVPDETAPGLPSTSAVWQDDGEIEIRVGSKPSPGNWIPIQSGTTPFILLAAFYDAPIPDGLKPAATPLPTIVRVGCRSEAP